MQDFPEAADNMNQPIEFTRGLALEAFLRLHPDIQLKVTDIRNAVAGTKILELGPDGVLRTKSDNGDAVDVKNTPGCFRLDKTSLATYEATIEKTVAEATAAALRGGDSDPIDARAPEDERSANDVLADELTETFLARTPKPIEPAGGRIYSIGCSNVAGLRAKIETAGHVFKPVESAKPGISFVEGPVLAATIMIALKAAERNTSMTRLVVSDSTGIGVWALAMGEGNGDIFLMNKQATTEGMLRRVLEQL